MRLRQTVHFDTRRTLSRRLRFNDPEAGRIFLYVLGLAAKEFNVRLHVFVLMGNHYHILVSVYDRNYPEFECFVNSQVARAMNRLHNVAGQFWENEYTNNADQTVLNAKRALEKSVYICRNPIRAGLESDLSEWAEKMALISPVDWGREIVIERPRVFWREVMPETVTLRPQPLPKLPQNFDPIAVMEEVSAIDRGATFLGVENLLKTSVFDVPLEEKLRWENSTSGRDIRVKLWNARKPLRRFSGTEDEEASAMESQAIFSQKHHARREDLIGGDRDTSFPMGTYALRRLGFSCKRDAPIHLLTRLIRGP